MNFKLFVLVSIGLLLGTSLTKNALQTLSKGNTTNPNPNPNPNPVTNQEGITIIRSPLSIHLADRTCSECMALRKDAGFICKTCIVSPSKSSSTNRKTTCTFKIASSSHMCEGTISCFDNFQHRNLDCATLRAFIDAMRAVSTPTA